MLAVFNIFIGGWVDAFQVALTLNSNPQPRP